MDDDEFADRRRGLSAQLTTLLAAMFGDLGSWRDGDVDPFLDQAVPLVQGTQDTLAQLTAVYVASQAAAAFGVEVEPPTLPGDVATDLRGVDPRTVYTRPFVTLRTGLARGKSLPEAVQLGTTRLGEIAEMDLQQSYAHASQAAMQRMPRRARPSYWARVLQGPGDCALCVVASTQRYRVGELNPIHPACDCTVKMLNVGRDPGQVIAPQLLEAVHAAVEELTGRTDRGARAPDYRKLMTQMTNRHGELGTLLTRPGDGFTGPGDIS